MLHCIASFIIILPSSQYDFNGVEREVKHKTILKRYVGNGEIFSPVCCLLEACLLIFVEIL